MFKTNNKKMLKNVKLTNCTQKCFECGESKI